MVKKMWVIGLLLCRFKQGKDAALVLFDAKLNKTEPVIITDEDLFKNIRKLATGGYDSRTDTLEKWALRLQKACLETIENWDKQMEEK